jgi:ATP-dependent RNA helicase DHX36
LDQLCLQIKALRLGDVAAFLSRAIEPPSAAAIRSAVEVSEIQTYRRLLRAT